MSANGSFSREGEALLCVRNLVKRFGSFEAVSGLDLTVGAGDVYGFLGLNGAGKTTTIRVTLGLLRASAGTVRLLGQEVRTRRPGARQDLGALVEGPAFYGRLTGMQNLCALGGLTRPVGRACARELLDTVGLDEAADRPARTYSLGMKQRLGIALALAADPRMIILDEPTNGLDPQGIRDIRDLLLRLNGERGLTMMISSHLLAEVEQLCNRVGIIHRGRMVLEGDVASLMARTTGPLRIRVSAEARSLQVLQHAAGGVAVRKRDGMLLLEDGGTLDSAALVKQLVAAGVDVHEVTRERRSLEDIFLDELPGGDHAA